MHSSENPHCLELLKSGWDAEGSSQQKVGLEQMETCPAVVTCRNLHAICLPLFQSVLVLNTKFNVDIIRRAEMVWSWQIWMDIALPRIQATSQPTSTEIRKTPEFFASSSSWRKLRKCLTKIKTSLERLFWETAETYSFFLVGKGVKCLFDFLFGDPFTLRQYSWPKRFLGDMITVRHLYQAGIRIKTHWRPDIRCYPVLSGCPTGILRILGPHSSSHFLVSLTYLMFFSYVCISSHISYVV